MNILYAAYIKLPTPKAHGVQILKTCEAFGDNGPNVELVIPKRNEKTPEEILQWYGIKNTFRIKIIPTPDLSWLGRFGFLMSEAIFSWRVRKYMKRKKHDILYSRYRMPIIFGLRRTPKVYEAHTPRWDTITRLAIGRACAVPVITRGLYEWHKERGVSEDKLKVAHDAVDLSYFKDAGNKAACRKQLGIPEGEVMVSYVGHLYARKGADTLARAAQYLSADTECYFIGGTTGDVEKFKAKYEGVSNVNVLGHKKLKDVPQYLIASDILVLPNSGKDPASAQFTSPMKLFEYMASGTPIVASDVPALREILDEQTAFFFTPDDPKDLADVIRYAQAHPDEAQKRAEQARIAVEEYTWHARAQAISDFITKQCSVI